MLRSYWLKYRKAIGLAVVVIVASTIVWSLISDLSAVSSQLEHRAADNARQYGEDAQEYISRRCARLAPLDSEDCIAKAEDARDTDQREEFDLSAQQAVAWWTRVMGVAALIGMGLSAVGVALVYATFRETRRTANVAWHIGMAQVRARLVLDTYSVTAPYGTLQGWRDSPQVFPLMLKNVGTTVAENIGVQGNITCRITGQEFSSALSLNPKSPQSIDGEKTERLQIVCDEHFKHAVAEHIGTLSGDWKTPFEATCEVRADDLFGGVDVIRFRVVGDFQALGQGAVNCWAEVDPASVGREQISKPTEPE